MSAEHAHQRAGYSVFIPLTPNINLPSTHFILRFAINYIDPLLYYFFALPWLFTTYRNNWPVYILSLCILLWCWSLVFKIYCKFNFILCRSTVQYCLDHPLLWSRYFVQFLNVFVQLFVYFYVRTLRARERRRKRKRSNQILSAHCLYSRRSDWSLSAVTLKNRLCLVKLCKLIYKRLDCISSLHYDPINLCCMSK